MMTSLFFLLSDIEYYIGKFLCILGAALMRSSVRIDRRLIERLESRYKPHQNIRRAP